VRSTRPSSRYLGVPSMGKYTTGLDLGQAQDYTAIAIIERVGEAATFSYHLGHLQRYPLHTGYPEIVDDVAKLLQTPPLPGETALVIDQTGVGAPVVDLFRRRQRRLSLPGMPVAPITPETIAAPLHPIHITGGTTVNEDTETNVWNVPKRDLVSTAAVLLQARRLRIAEGLPEARTLVDELLNFQVKITDSGRDTYGAWREGTHDDLVLAVALACWWAERFGQPRGPMWVPFQWKGPFGDERPRTML